MHRTSRRASWLVGTIYAAAAMTMIGCAGGPPRPAVISGMPSVSTVRDGASPAATSPHVEAVSSTVPMPPQATTGPRGTETTASSDESLDDPFYDPFAKNDEPAGGEEYDPWEPLNTKIFEFNRQVDRWVLKPVAQGYDAVVPNPVQIGISNVFANIRFPSRLINNLAQGKLSGAGTEVGRFLLNSTFGLGGLVDVARYLDITTPEEDTGQTLGYYGVTPGPYLVVPFLPPLLTVQVMSP